MLVPLIRVLGGAGNTGSFMVRWGAWKYVAFGTAGAAFAQGYTPQLFVRQGPSGRTRTAGALPAAGSSQRAVLDSLFESGSVLCAIGDRSIGRSNH